MKKLLISGLVALMTSSVLAPAAMAAGGEFPKKKPHYVDWSFSGPFGYYDQQQLQRGFQVFKEVCSSCHSLDLIAFRNFEDLGYSPEQVQAIAAEYEVLGAPNEDGDREMRAAKSTDYWPNPYENAKQAASLNNGALPPDFSKLTMARAVKRGFPTFIYDIATQYAESGPDYVYSLLTGYGEEPAHEIGEGLHYNPYFIAGEALAMAAPLDDGLVTYADGSPETTDQYAQDVTAFMQWAAEPTLPERKRMGFIVMIFLIVLSGLLYATKKHVYRGIKKDA